MDLILERIRSGGPDSRAEAAAEIRRLTRTSSENRRALSGAIEPLVAMLRADSGPECNEAAILALLNLAVKDERNKMKIVETGGLESLLPFLESFNPTLQEYATAALLTLSASPAVKPILSASGAVPLLVKPLSDGTPQAKADAVAALYNLSAHPPNLAAIASSRAVPPLLAHLRACRKSSRTAEKCLALLESLAGSEDGRDSLVSADGGVLAIVEAVEEGSPSVRERAVGALLAMCEADRDKYRGRILEEGAIPGLLELTVRGTTAGARRKARELLALLRDAPRRPREEALAEADALESVIGNIVSKIDGDDRMGKAKKMLAEMVQLSMEQSLRHLQQRAHW
ncbi:U-box domain-containing protein 4 isoform X1 [Iris pallida]|uniref:U-box domain-containing protein 4 isoform X1 n=1 Tax=Iris pallida TaxID=29817 RepID=A0AAX6EHA2_IRIPA|nr:U-box domain-containing protein 4 isoform X1 [Iris pallida]